MKSVEELEVLMDLSGEVFEQLNDQFDYEELDRLFQRYKTGIKIIIKRTGWRTS